MFPTKRIVAISAIALFSAALPAWADPEEDEDDKKNTDWIEAVQATLYKGDYAGALDQLKQANDTKSADWNNLMGFALRKNSPPDLVSAEKHYQNALRIKPDHIGALEYYGELKLMNKDLAGAQMLQTRLKAACPSGCEQLSDLNAAINKYKQSQ